MHRFMNAIELYSTRGSWTTAQVQAELDLLEQLDGHKKCPFCGTLFAMKAELAAALRRAQATNEIVVGITLMHIWKNAQGGVM